MRDFVRDFAGLRIESEPVAGHARRRSDGAWPCRIAFERNGATKPFAQHSGPAPLRATDPRRTILFVGCRCRTRLSKQRRLFIVMKTN
ncbi:hypothetical protein ABU614_15430 [Lysobacter firmicutimachus]|uniref:Uncharacterized protein n=1 Tax=Lysobacter firmicutimachus TaxID=1792846 RepID=A0AAU8MRN3_9GAMM